MRLCNLFCFLCLVQVKLIFGQQLPDLDFQYDLKRIEFESVSSPTIAIDEAHNNYHTLSGGFAPLTKLLKTMGFDVVANQSSFSSESLKNIDILIIANALSDENKDTRILPAIEAFSAQEIKALISWIENGGSLLLIADHMPYPGSVKQLSSQLGVQFYNGFAVYRDNHVGTYTFTPEKGLSKHDTTLYPNTITKVMSFPGSAFDVSKEYSVLLSLPPNFKMRFPDKEWEFNSSTPERKFDRMHQGAVRKLGSGKVAVFAEAAMFTAQVHVEDGKIVNKVGFNIPEALENILFIENLFHWLADRVPNL